VKKVLSLVVVTCMCAVLTLPAFAAHPLATDDAGTVGMMKFQLETSAEFGWDKESEHGISTTSRYQTLNTSLTAGLLDSLDLVLSCPYSWQKIEDNSGGRLNNSGLNDLSLELKWRFMELGPASFAIKPAITFPTADRDRGLGNGQAGYGATLISTVEIKPLALHANIGYTRQKYTDADRDGCRENLWNLSLAGAVEVMKGFQVVAEIGTASNPDRGSSIWPAFMAGGLIYSVLENLDLSLGIKGGLNTPETDLALLAGITFRLP